MLKIAYIVGGSLSRIADLPCLARQRSIGRLVGYLTHARYSFAPMSPWWLLVFLAVLLIGVTKSGFGAGVGLMIVPMTVVAMGHLPGGAEATLGLMLPLLIVGDVIAVGQYRRLVNFKIVRRLLPGTVLGILVGGWLLLVFKRQPQQLLTALIKIEIGLESVGLVGLHWYRTWRAGTELKFRPSMVRSSAVGAFAGASSTLAHAAGPIIALHLLPQKLDRQVFVGTCAVYFFLVNMAKVPVYAWSAHQFHPDILLLSLKLAPLVFVGAGFGFWVTRRMNDQLFSKIVYALTFCLGWYLLVDGGRAVRAAHAPPPIQKTTLTAPYGSLARSA